MSAYLTIRIPEWLDKICVWPLLVYRRLKYGYTFRKIYLGEGEFTIVEPPDYYAFAQFKWFLWGSGYNFYAVREVKIGPNKTRRSYLHREIMKPRKGRVIDHRNVNSLDNRRDNLRHATRAQNNYNRRKTRKKTTSRFIGIHLEKRDCNWKVQIRNQGKLIYIGRYDNEIDAARAYDCAALKYHGEFARLNFPREDYVKVGNSYKFVGKSGQAECSGSLGGKLNKIYSSILGRFEK
jgi:hypothetical protein